MAKKNLFLDAVKAAAGNSEIENKLKDTKLEPFENSEFAKKDDSILSSIINSFCRKNKEATFGDLINYLKSNKKAKSAIVRFNAKDVADDKKEKTYNFQEDGTKRFGTRTIRNMYNTFNAGGGAANPIEEIDFSFETPEGEKVSLNDILSDLYDPKRHGSFNNKKFDISNNTGVKNPMGPRYWKDSADTYKADKFMKKNDQNIYNELTMHGLLDKRYMSSKFFESESMDKIPTLYSILLEDTIWQDSGREFEKLLNSSNNKRDIIEKTIIKIADLLDKSNANEIGIYTVFKYVLKNIVPKSILNALPNPDDRRFFRKNQEWIRDFYKLIVDKNDYIHNAAWAIQSFYLYDFKEAIKEFMYNCQYDETSRNIPKELGAYFRNLQASSGR